MKEYKFTTPCTTKEYNTNNAWGFGGGRGTEYVFSDQLSAKIGLAGTRHSGEFGYITIRHNNKLIFDEANTIEMRAKANGIINLLWKT